VLQVLNVAPRTKWAGRIKCRDNCVVMVVVLFWLVSLPRKENTGRFNGFLLIMITSHSEHREWPTGHWKICAPLASTSVKAVKQMLHSIASPEERKK
jgi:hypothetical protein